MNTGPQLPTQTVARWLSHCPSESGAHPKHQQSILLVQKPWNTGSRAMFWEFVEEMNCHHWLPGNISLFHSFPHVGSCLSLVVKLLMWTALDTCTCLNFGVVGALRHLLLADEVINNPDTNWWLSVVPLHDHQWTAGLIGVRQFQPGNRATEM